MRRGASLVSCTLVWCAAAGDVLAQRFSFEALTGSAYNLPTPLTVRQSGYPDIRLTARYDTKPFGPFYPYYSWRASFWNKERTAAWELTQVHHRLFLDNKPPEIETFEIHYGYNFYMAGRAWKRGDFVYHVDGGVVITNPTNTVRGLVLKTRDTGLFDAGYSLAGVGGQFAVSRNVQLAKHVYLVGNLAFIAGRANVPVVNGSARVPTMGVHGQLGAGVIF